MKKVFVSIGAVTIIVVAAMNVNVSLMTGKVPNVSLANVQALANPECEQDGAPMLSHSNYKMAITNTDKRGAVAIKNDNPTVLNSASFYGLDVEQSVLAGRRNHIAIRAYSVAPLPVSTSYTRAYGVYATAGNAYTGYNYGVFANLAGCQNGAALFATDDDMKSQTVNGRYAGYFQGRVHAAGMSVGGTPNLSYTLHVSGNIGLNGSLLHSSDSRYKTNVKNLGSSLEKIAQLRPVTYNFKAEDLSEYYALVPDSVKISNEKELRRYFGLGMGRDTKRKHTGFIAQEVQGVFPELVQKDDKGMLSVNYVELIPVLAGAVQEQQKIIQEQNETIQMLISRLEALEKNMNNAQENNFSFSLSPNPASAGFVTVDYTMKVDAPISIELYNSFGQKIKMLASTQKQNAGTYSVQTSVSELAPGTYIVKATSGNQIESKQLIIK
jgi:hypothetical protein